MRLTVWFKENGEEYRGCFDATDVHHVSFDPQESTRVVRINGARIEMDEDITDIQIGHTPAGLRPLTEAWELHDWTPIGRVGPLRTTK